MPRKIVPVIGGSVSSGLTFRGAPDPVGMGLKRVICAEPPSWIDAEAWAQHVLDTTPGARQVARGGRRPETK